MATTTIRGLQLMAGSDAAATIDDTYDQAMNILDGAAFYTEDAMANRPSPALARKGTLFKPTDASLAGYLYLSDGVSWIEVAPGMGAAPIGASMDWWAAGDPGDTRWVKMDGRELSQTTYAALFALIGTAWNTFDGQAAPAAGNFRIPRTFGRDHITAGTGNGLTARTLGAAGGEERHTLTEAEMPSHTHDLLNGAGGLAFVATASGGNGPTPNAPPTGYNGGFLNIGAKGGNGSHNVMNPFVACHRIMRIA